MIRIEFPPPSFKIKNENGKEKIFDTCRKLWVLLTPEEWVRQNFLQYLMEGMHYPCSLIAVEKEIKLGDLRKRFDIVVYKNNLPWMLVECKEMREQVNETVLRQALNYNIALQVRYIVVTNGRDTFAAGLQQNSLDWLTELPGFNEV